MLEVTLLLTNVQREIFSQKQTAFYKKKTTETRESTLAVNHDQCLNGNIFTCKTLVNDFNQYQSLN